PATAGSGLSALASSAPTRAAPIAESLIESDDADARRAALMVASQLSGDASARIMVSALQNRDPEFVREALEMVAHGYQTEDVRAAVRALGNSELPEDLKARAAEIVGSAVGQDGYAMHEAPTRHMIY
ncbi:MAG TPA: hypothetical protein VI299_21100, partial [Polyangiales bacterium]